MFHKIHYIIAKEKYRGIVVIARARRRLTPVLWLRLGLLTIFLIACPFDYMAFAVSGKVGIL